MRKKEEEDVRKTNRLVMSNKWMKQRYRNFKKLTKRPCERERDRERQRDR